MPAEPTPPPTPGNRSQRDYRRLAAYLVAGAVGLSAMGAGHAIASGLSESRKPKIYQALDLRHSHVEPKVEQANPARPSPSLTVEPVAIVGEGDEQSLELRVESEPRVGDEPIGSRYGISWYVQDHKGNVAIPDAPSVHPLSSDALQVVERVLVPLNLSDGYYRLTTTIKAANDQNRFEWTAVGSMYFRIDLGQLLIMHPQDWVWESIRVREGA